MKKIVMTREIRRAYYLKRKGNTSRSKPKVPYCGGCSDLTKRRPIVNFIKPGEECYEVHFANGGVGYYHLDHVADTVKSLDVDKWIGIDEFIKTQVDKQFSDKQIMAEIARQFNCSHTTAWRRLRGFKTKLP